MLYWANHRVRTMLWYSKWLRIRKYEEGKVTNVNSCEYVGIITLKNECWLWNMWWRYNISVALNRKEITGNVESKSLLPPSPITRRQLHTVGFSMSPKKCMRLINSVENIILFYKKKKHMQFVFTHFKLMFDSELFWGKRFKCVCARVLAPSSLLSVPGDEI